LPDDAERNPRLYFDGWALDLGARQLFSPAGSEVDLSAGEFDLLSALAQRPRRVLSRDQLLDLCKGRAAQPFDRSIDVQVGRLRKKIEADPTQPKIITTVRGGGYMFAPEVTRDPAGPESREKSETAQDDSRA
jgi:two-component system OmpR family response regulator